MNDLFKATKRVPFASQAELNKFVDGLVEAWERNERTRVEVHEKCVLLMADSAEGKPIIEGKAIYAKALGAKLKDLGCFMEESANTLVKNNSPYA